MKRLAVLSFVVILSVGACDSNTQAYQFVNSFIRKWTGHTIKETLRYTLGIPTGSSWKDDLIDQQRADDTFETAQKLYEAALKQNSQEFLQTATDLVDQAIKLEPNDYRYRLTRASLAMQQGNSQEMDFQIQEAFSRIKAERFARTRWRGWTCWSTSRLSSVVSDRSMSPWSRA